MATRWAGLLPLILMLQSCGGSPSGDSSPSNTNSTVVLLETRARAGITATPSQDGSYPVGANVNYSFVAADPLASVEVTMDGAPVAASGTASMSTWHRFEAAIRNHPGYHAHEFRGQTSDGQTIRLSDYRGRYVLVDFSETSCPGSVNQAAFLEARYAALQAKGMDIVTVLVHGTTIGTTGSQFDASATASDVAAWKSNNALSFPVLVDTDNSTLIYNWDNQAQSTDFPATYIVDPNGVILYKFRGFDGPTLDAALTALFP